MVWAPPRSLAATKGMQKLLNPGDNYLAKIKKLKLVYFPLGTEMFHFPRYASIKDGLLRFTQ